MTREEAGRIVRSAGGVPVTSVSRRTSMLVVGMAGWPLLPDGTVSRKLHRAETLNRSGGRIRIVSEAVFLELAGLAERRPDLRKSYPAQRVCELLGLDSAALHRWEALGLIRAEDGLYDFQDLVSLRTIAELVGCGVDPQTISRSVRGLASVLPGTERPLSQLKIVVEDPGTLLAELGEVLVAPDGQLLLNFTPDRAGDPDATPVRLAAEPGAGSAEAWFEHGQVCETEERLEEAERAYREALSIRPRFPEAQFNLGNVLRGLGRLEQAEERYRTALDQNPALAVAWYNLADLLDETGRVDEAIASLHRALDVSPAYADAHFNLACFYEQTGLTGAASEHWQAYLKLDPTSEWADVARKRLSSIVISH
ncbi:MAG: tetratricopeptide repeat protein [Planctomycetota bacterium]|jgi:tetratricopeptide (TPR) repeat protein